MTKFQEFPLRPVGQPWFGLNTRGGKIDPGMGQLEDGSFNQIINEADILSKRPGFVRGLEERFNGVVCGLFRYTDECNVEYLLVADSSGTISIRTPFTLPENANSDAYPIDAFEDTLNTDNWQNTSLYQTASGSLELINSADVATSVATARLMQWFKDAANLTYFTQIEYEFNTLSAVQQSAAVVIKRTGTNYVLAEVVYDGTNYTATLYLVTNDSRKTLATQPLGGVSLGTGFLKLTFAAPTTPGGPGVPTMAVFPSGGATVSVTGTISALEEAGLGLGTAIGLAGPGPGIKQVNGGPV